MTVYGPDPVLERWDSEAETLRRWGHEEEAEILETCADEVRAWWAERELVKLSVEEAAAVSGYSPNGLRKLRRRGELTDAVSDDGERRYILGELPRKPSRCTNGDGEEVPDLASDIISGRIEGGSL